MADTLSPTERSALMARVRSKNTRPEMLVRSIVHRLGSRFRLHDSSLPGSPDLVFRGRGIALFVHGCFWHSHSGCKWATVPKTRTEYWSNKLAANRDRDRRAQAALRRCGWRVAVVWECETRKPAHLVRRLSRMLPPKSPEGARRAARIVDSYMGGR
jgi:DNA mismatch endonuclease (patch repair protein)